MLAAERSTTRTRGPMHFRVLVTSFMVATFILMCVQLYGFGPDFFSSVSSFVAFPNTKLRELPNWIHYIALGVAPVSSDFPSDELITVTINDHVERRNVSVGRLFSCFGDKLSKGKNSSQGMHSESIYDFVILPIGCFGDLLSSCTSCAFAHSLIDATYCGRKKIGLFLGDNFYPHGIRSWKDRRFQTDLRQKFFRFPELQMTYYATSGNHDMKPKFLYREHRYWKMPAPYYTSGILESSGTTVEIFVYSTNPHETVSSKEEFFRMQANWLNDALGNSTARWKIVMTHEPVFVFAGFLHHKWNLEIIHPILKRHGVQLLVCAHVHGVYLHRVEGGYYQLISAGFVNNAHSRVQPRRPLGYNHLGSGATALLVGRDAINVVAFDKKANLVFHHKIPCMIDGSSVKVTQIASMTHFDVFKIHSHEEHFYPL